MAKKRVKRAEGEQIDFEAALAELEEIVHALEDGEIGLSESLARYERGVKLLRRCYHTLDGAQRRIEMLTAVDSEGRPVLAPVDDSELTLAQKAEKRSRRRSSGEGEASPYGEGPVGGSSMDDSENVT